MLLLYGILQFQQTQRTGIASICLIAALLLTSGCTNKKFTTYPVSGVVKFEDGSVVKAGRIEFHNQEQKVSARGTIGSDGTFVMGTETSSDGAVAGVHQVLIMQVITRTQTGITAHDHGAHVEDRYANFRTSGLTFTVEPDAENVAEFVVRKRKERGK